MLMVLPSGQAAEAAAGAKEMAKATTLRSVLKFLLFMDVFLLGDIDARV